MVLERINRQIHASTDPQHFATLFLAIFDPATRRLLLQLRRPQRAGGRARATAPCELLEKGGLPLGAFDFGTYEEGEVQLEDGDLLFLYTDGLTETKGPDGDEEFGEDRLDELLLRERERRRGQRSSTTITRRACTISAAARTPTTTSP